MSKPTDEAVEAKARELLAIWHWKPGAEEVRQFSPVARHVLTLEAAARAAGASEERKACLADVDAEAELPGDPPAPAMFAMLEDPVKSMRAAVRVTKRGIADRIKARALPAEP